MPWAVAWTEQAVRDLNRLDPAIARRLVMKLEQAAGNPTHFFARLAGQDEYKLGVGDYRLIAALSHESDIILVERVDHRSRFYSRNR